MHGAQVSEGNQGVQICHCEEGRYFSIKLCEYKIWRKLNITSTMRNDRRGHRRETQNCTVWHRPKTKLCGV